MEAALQFSKTSPTFRRHLFTEIKPVLQHGVIQSTGTKEVGGGETKQANNKE